MNKLTDEAIDAAREVARKTFRRSQSQIRGQQITASDNPEWHFARAIEAAATEPLLQRIEELERQLEEARKDADRWKMTIEISQDVLRHPDSRKIPASVSAYMNSIHKGYDMTYAVDAAIDAAMQNDKPVGVIFQKGQA